MARHKERLRPVAAEPEASTEPKISGDLFYQINVAARALSGAGEFRRADALEVASLRLGELRTVMPAAIEAAPDELRSVLRDFYSLI